MEKRSLVPGSVVVRDLRTLLLSEMSVDEFQLWCERRASMHASDLQKANSKLSRRDAMKAGRIWIASVVNSDFSSEFCIARDAEVLSKRTSLGLDAGAPLTPMPPAVVLVTDDDADHVRRKAIARVRDTYVPSDDPSEDYRRRVYILGELYGQSLIDRPEWRDEMANLSEKFTAMGIDCDKALKRWYDPSGVDAVA